MASRYTDVRRRWRAVEPQRELERLWQVERFEDTSAIEEALRVYELAVSLHGWEAVKGWSRAALEEGRILNAHLIELAMRALEKGDTEFVTEITSRLLAQAPPSYFRFWYTLFCTRHSHAGERLFRIQLGALDDYRVVKYRRWLRKILRKLRFRCKTPREKAIGAIAFGVNKDYDPKAYPSEIFDAYLACHKAAQTRAKTKQGAPVSAERHAAQFAEAAAKLGIWSVVEGIRTSARISRTRAYLAAMAPKMTDLELRRALKAFDARMQTASHQKAPEDVVKLSSYLTTRLRAMQDITLEDWGKIYPYLQSRPLRSVLEDVLSARITAQSEALREQSGWGFAPLIVPETLEARAFRAALLVAYLHYSLSPNATLYLVRQGVPRFLTPPSPLFPFGEGAAPHASHWKPAPEEPHRALYGLLRETFPLAAKRRSTAPVGVDGYLQALRHHLHRRQLLFGSASSQDVPLLVLTHEPTEEEQHALLAHLAMFPAAALVRLDAPWKKSLEAPHIFQLYVPPTVLDLTAPLTALAPSVAEAQKAFATRKAEVDRATRHLLCAPPPIVEHIAQGPHRT